MNNSIVSNGYLAKKNNTVIYGNYIHELTNQIFNNNIIKDLTNGILIINDEQDSITYSSDLSSTEINKYMNERIIKIAKLREWKFYRLISIC